MSEKAGKSDRNRISTSLSWRPEDLEKAREEADKAGMPLAVWVRQLVIQELKKVESHRPPAAANPGIRISKSNENPVDTSTMPGIDELSGQDAKKKANPDDESDSPRRKKA